LIEARVRLEGRQDGPAVHRWHHDVEGDGVGGEFGGEAKPFGPGGCDGDAKAFFGEGTARELAGIFVIVDDEDEAFVGAGSRGGIVGR
jgi:hypothetical protein